MTINQDWKEPKKMNKKESKEDKIFLDEFITELKILLEHYRHNPICSIDRELILQAYKYTYTDFERRHMSRIKVSGLRCDADLLLDRADSITKEADALSVEYFGQEEPNDN